MKIYDISQEVFSSCVFPGDPSPKKETVSSIKNGDACNLTAFSMCAHNGTHIDAPLHFVDGGAGIADIALEKTVGYAFVVSFDSLIGKAQAKVIVEKAKNADERSAKKILIKGEGNVTTEGAKELLSLGVELFGVESQTLGSKDEIMAVHKAVLSEGAVILEGLRLSDVSDGAYLLFAAPLSLEGSDGAPVRAVLVKEEQ